MFLPDRIPTLLGAIVLALLALFVWRTRLGNRVHMSFALFLWVVAWAHGLLAWASSFDALATRLLVYAMLAIPWAGGYFIYCFLAAHRPGIWRHPVVPIGLLMGWLTSVAVFWLNRERFLAPPFWIIQVYHLEALTFAILAVGGAWSIRGVESPRQRRSLRFFAAGMALAVTFSTVTSFTDQLAGAPPLDTALIAATGLLLLATIVLLWIHQGEQHATAILLTGAAALIVDAVRTSSSGGSDGILLFTLNALVLVAGTGMVAYGIVHSHFFRIDLQLKWSFHKGTWTAMLGIVFLVIAETAEEFIPATGALTQILASGGVGVLVLPLERVARKITERLFPRVVATPAYMESRRRELFDATVEEVATLDMPNGEQILRDRRVQLGLHRELEKRHDRKRRATTS